MSDVRKKRTDVRKIRTGMLVEVFYEMPQKKFSVRELSEITGLAKSTVQDNLERLKQQGMVKKNNSATNSDYFKIKKTHYYIEKMFEIGLIDYIVKELNPETVILFGSFRKGESVKESDIDLFVMTHSKKEIDLKKYEKKIGHEIELHVQTGIKKLPDNLLNNVVNGIKLYGSFRVK